MRLRYSWGPLLLTPAEMRVAREVVRCVREGEATIDIVPDRLCISLKSVKWQLTNIYRQLGVSSREQLAEALSGHEPKEVHPL